MRNAAKFVLAFLVAYLVLTIALGSWRSIGVWDLVVLPVVCGSGLLAYRWKLARMQGT